MAEGMCAPDKRPARFGPLMTKSVYLFDKKAAWA